MSIALVIFWVENYDERIASLSSQFLNWRRLIKILLIGGTGLISSACSELAVEHGHELFLESFHLDEVPAPKDATVLQADVHTDEARLAALLAGRRFDAVVDWVAFTPEDIEQIRLFRGKTDQFVFISSATAYQKPPKHYIITEETPLENPFWQYSRDKIATEQRLMEEYRENGLPVTIIRPSLTYGLSPNPADWRELAASIHGH